MAKKINLPPVVSQLPEENYLFPAQDGNDAVTIKASSLDEAYKKYADHLKNLISKDNL